jgi:hypothetical protein
VQIFRITAEADVTLKLKPMRKVNIAIYQIATTLVIGSLLYMLARPSGLIAFQWFEAFGLGHALKVARAAVAPWSNRLPQFVRFSLPDGLWAFSFTRAMCLVWEDVWTRQSMSWILLGPVVAIGSELGQAIHIIPGTFDIMDLFAVGVACVIAVGLSLVPRRRLRPIFQYDTERREQND